MTPDYALFTADGTAYAVDAEVTHGATIKPPALQSCPHIRQVIKNGPLFVVSHSDGAMHPGCSCGQGLYISDTRHLSGLLLLLEDQPLEILSFSGEQNVFSRADLLNRELTDAEGRKVRKESVHVAATRLIETDMHERVVMSNFNPHPVRLRLRLELRADFLDMFEVRGFTERQRHGTYLRPIVGEDRVTLAYLGSDQRRRETIVCFGLRPDRLEEARFPETGEVGAIAYFDLHLDPGAEQALEFTVAPRGDGRADRSVRPMEFSADRLDMLQQQLLSRFTGLSSTHEGFHEFLNRGVLDLLSLVNPMESGPYLVAGLPWYACPFGRDGLITAYQALMLDPGLAEGTLRYLALRQGSREDASCDEEPGKILHESREGELSLTGEMPFAPSFCTVDATPLFLVLLSEHYRWTGNLSLVQELWPNVRRALDWIDRFGDVDGDGFVEYERKGDKGLANQGWKDSWDSVIHPDGTLAEAPIALAEVQGYVYDAKRRVADLAERMGDSALAERLRSEAQALKIAFNEAFWNQEQGYYVIALDGAKRQVVSPTSNPGHGLWSGIIDEARAPSLVAELLSPGMFSGWGIRTMSSSSPNFNPMSYHNGTIWPHDNSLIAQGLADYGFVHEAALVLEGLFETSRHFAHHRLPELFCGFPKDGRFARPIPYPVACSPQAWAAGTPLLLLQSVLGIRAEAPNGVLRVIRPNLPACAGDISLTGLRIGRATVDLAFANQEGQTTCRVLRQEGDVRVVVEG